MREQITFLEIMAIISPALSVLFAFLAFRRGQKTDDSASAREMATVLSEIGYVKSQVDAVNRKLENNDERYIKLAERMSAVEDAAKGANNRIDNLMKRVSFNDKN